MARTSSGLRLTIVTVVAGGVATLVVGIPLLLDIKDMSLFCISYRNIEDSSEMGHTDSPRDF